MCDIVINEKNDVWKIKHLKNDEINFLFCNTDYIMDLFESIIDYNCKIVLVTHNSDVGIDKGLFEKKPRSVTKWFSQNVKYVHNDLIAIPIGISNDTYEKNKKHLKMRYEQDNKCVYMCFNIDTNSKHRQYVRDVLTNYDVVIDDTNSNLSFEMYCNNLSRCKYNISPDGNGIDCYRTWESIYMGVIPIIVNKHLEYHFGDMPIIFLKDYKEIENDIHNIRINFKSERYKFSYWKNLFDTIKKLGKCN